MEVYNADDIHFTFDLETRQWVDVNGTPLSTTPTATPAGQWVPSLTLFNAETDQPVVGFDPLLSGATLSFSALGTRNLNIRANTSPAVVGSVTFTLDGALVRTETGAPYAIGGNNGADYAAWTPAVGAHTLVVTPYTGSGGSGTAGTPLTISFTVVEGTASTATHTPTVVPASATPVATATASRTPTPGAGGGTVLLVVGNAVTLSSGDSAVKTRLESPPFNYTVVLKDHAAATTADASGKILVYVSGSVSSGNVLAKFRDVAVPVITTEFGIYDDMGMSTTATNDFATSPAGTTLEISTPGHPLAGGLTGTRTVLTAAKGMPYGTPNGNAVKIAPQGTSNSKAVLFAYEAGVLMPGLTSPARRLGFFLPHDATPAPDGWTLFDAAIHWATGQ